MILNSKRKGNDCIRKLRYHCIQILHSDIYSVCSILDTRTSKKPQCPSFSVNSKETSCGCKATLNNKWCWWPKMFYETQCIRTHHNIVWLYSLCSKMVVQSVQQYLLCPRMGLFSLFRPWEMEQKKLWDKHINLSWLSFYSYFLMILKAFLLLSSSCNLEIRTCDKNSGYIQPKQRAISPFLACYQSQGEMMIPLITNLPKREKWHC